jgi:hypothetical protein
MDFHKANKIFFGVAVVAALAAVVTGFLIIGSPGYQRKVAADRERENDLRNIAYDISYPGGQYGLVKPSASSTLPLPKSLEDIRTSVPQTLIPQTSGAGFPIRDPKTHELYGYRIIDETHYELCATFETPRNEKTGERPFFWNHPAGRACFTLNALENPPAYWSPGAGNI